MDFVGGVRAPARPEPLMRHCVGPAAFKFGNRAGNRWVQVAREREPYQRQTRRGFSSARRYADTPTRPDRAPLDQYATSIHHNHRARAETLAHQIEIRFRDIFWLAHPA
jgi:hypothetical protein